MLEVEPLHMNLPDVAIREVRMAVSVSNVHDPASCKRCYQMTHFLVDTCLYFGIKDI